MGRVFRTWQGLINRIFGHEVTSKPGAEEELQEVLRTLTPREEQVIRLRQHQTLREVGKRFGVSPERIRQIEAKALRKLRHPDRSRRLKQFLEEE